MGGQVMYGGAGVGVNYGGYTGITGTAAPGTAPARTGSRL
jgi:hypothetical protein